VKKIFFYTIIYYSCCFTNAAAQTDPIVKQEKKETTTFSLIKFIQGDFTYLNVDLFNNIYIITSNNQLKKIAANGDSIAVYNDVKKFGALSYIDVSNPFKLLLYFKKYNTIVTLDQLLTFRNSINLRSKNIFNVNAVATSYDNNIWVFDERNYQLKKIDDNGTTISESTDLRMITDEFPSPSAILEHNNQLYLYDENKGFFIFDYYGSMKNKIPFLHWKNPSIERNYIYGFVEQSLFSYELNSLNLQEYKMPDLINKYSCIKAVNKKLYVLKKEGIYIYQIN